jgi:hypothetical protein
MQRSVQSINTEFSAGMRSMGVGGSVELTEFDDDITQARVAGQVSFRAGEPLQQLGSTRHSGGERAVSTILLLLAMQRVTPLPFRVLDEINQGMAVRNERTVMERLVAAMANMADAAARGQTGDGGDDDSGGAGGAGAGGDGAAGGGFVRGRQLFIISPKLMPNLVHHPSMRTHVVFNGPEVGGAPAAARALTDHFVVNFAAYAGALEARPLVELDLRAAVDKAAAASTAAAGAQRLGVTISKKSAGEGKRARSDDEDEDAAASGAGKGKRARGRPAVVDSD